VSDRIRPTDVVNRTSLSLRQVQSLAALGKIPGAAKLGGVWTFDPNKIDAWIGAAERATSRIPALPSARGGISTSGVSIAPDVSIDAAYERLIRGKQQKARKHTFAPA
jgi:hypothetical protein